jgi:hypothetical protein
MNNIISKVAASVLLAGVVISGLNAKSVLTIDGNASITSTDVRVNQAFPIDILGAGEEANLTFIPNINAAPGSGFTLKFENGGYAETSSIFLCTYADANESNTAQSNLTAIVGNMFSKGVVTNGVMTEPKFQFKNDANETQIEDGSHIFFRTDSECKQAPAIVGVGASCLTVSAQIVDGITTQSTPFPDYDTDTRTLGETKRMIRIACKTPVCQIDASKDKKDFTLAPPPTGINTLTGIVPTSFAQLIDCPECDQSQACTTWIEIENNSAKYALDTMKFQLNFLDDKGVKNNTLINLKEVEIHLDNNETQSAKIDGSTISLTGLNMGQSTSWIRLKYTPTTTDIISSGKVSGRIFGLDTNKTGADDVIYDNTNDMAQFIVAGLTKFTVPYMNTNYKTFVKITTKSETPAELSAIITDQDGKTTEVTLDSIPAKGTVYLFSTQGPLFDAAKAAGLGNAWTVDFTTTAAAVVDSYMTTANGERRVQAFD